MSQSGLNRRIAAGVFNPRREELGRTIYLDIEEIEAWYASLQRTTDLREAERAQARKRKRRKSNIPS